MALLEPDARALDLMQAEFNLHPLAIEDARHGHQRPKIEEYGEVLCVVLHMIEQPSDGQLLVGEVAVFVGRNYILSVRSGVEKGFQDVRARCENEPELLRRGPGYVLYALMDAVVDRYFPLLQGVEIELERIEEQIFAAALPRASIEALYSLKQRECRQCAQACRITSATSPITCSGSARRSNRFANPRRRRSP